MRDYELAQHLEKPLDIPSGCQWMPCDIGQQRLAQLDGYSQYSIIIWHRWKWTRHCLYVCANYPNFVFCLDHLNYFKSQYLFRWLCHERIPDDESGMSYMRRLRVRAP
jgi:hypothetical protein